MGWLFFDNYTKTDLVKRLIRKEENDQRIYKTLKHSIRGSVLWTVRTVSFKESGEVITMIVCYLLERSVKNAGKKKIVSWGYKDMDESSHPYYYSCPISYFKDAPVACQEWRDKVYDYHRKMNCTLNIGDKLLLDSCAIPFVEVLQVSPLIGIYSGKRYRVSRKLIKDIKRETMAA